MSTTSSAPAQVLVQAFSIHQLEVGKTYHMATPQGGFFSLGTLQTLQFHHGSYQTGDPWWDVYFETPPLPNDKENYTNYMNIISYGPQNITPSFYVLHEPPCK